MHQANGFAYAQPELDEASEKANYVDTDEDFESKLLLQAETGGKTTTGMKKGFLL